MYLTEAVPMLYLASCTQCPIPCNVTSTDFRPSRRSTHMFHRLIWSLWVCWWTRLAGGSPRSSCNSNVATWTWSFRILSIALQMVRWLCPTSFENPLFHSSHKLFVLEPPSRVMVCTFHIDGANMGGLWRMQIGGIVPSGRCGDCIWRQDPETYVLSKYCCNGSNPSGDKSFPWLRPLLARKHPTEEFHVPLLAVTLY